MVAMRTIQFVIASLLIVVVGSPSAADTLEWNAPTGSWFDAFNWSPQLVPDDSDRVYVDNGGTTSIVGPVVAEAERLYVGDDYAGAVVVSDAAQLSASHFHLGTLVGSHGDVLVSGPGSTLSAVQFHVGDEGSGTLSIQAGGQVSTSHGHLGHELGSQGDAVISGAGSTWSSNFITVGDHGDGTLMMDTGGKIWGSFLTVGGQGNGMMTVDTGATVYVTGSNIGRSSAFTGQATVTGPGSFWSTSHMNVGYGGNGTLTVDDGAQVDSNRLRVGRGAGSTGHAFVSGEDSVLKASRLYVGDGGDGTITVSDGGYLRSGYKNYIGAEPGASGEVIVRDPGSTWYSGNDVTVGMEGAGVVRLHDGGRFSVVDDLTFGPLGLLEAGLSAPVSEALVTAGRLHLAGTLNVSLLDGYFPVVGDRFDLLDWGALDGAFETLLTPTLTPGLGWDVSELYTTGEVAVMAVPLVASVDVKPGNSGPNPVNLKSKGLLPVAVYGSEIIDVSQIDLDTILLSGAAPRQKPNGQWHIAFDEINGDSFLDLILHFEMQALGIEVGVDALILTGMLDDDRELEGADSIRIVPDFNGDLIVNAADLAILRAGFGAAADFEGGDANGDGLANATDLARMKVDFGFGEPVLGEPIPEPATMGLLGLGGMAVLRRRSR